MFTAVPPTLVCAAATRTDDRPDPAAVARSGRRAAAARRRIPRPTSVGAFCVSDAATLFAGFVWFDGEEGLARFLSEDVPCLSGRCVPARFHAQEQEQAQHGDSRAPKSAPVAPPPVAPAACDIDAFNRLLAPRGVRVTWVGRYQDLLSGTGAVARQVRAMFRRTGVFIDVSADVSPEGATASVAPVRPEERTRFRGFLRALGPSDLPSEPG